MSLKNKFAIGAVIGAVAGIIAGVLTAPKSGKQTRADIKIKAAELKKASRRSAVAPEAPSSDTKKKRRRTKKA